MRSKIFCLWNFFLICVLALVACRKDKPNTDIEQKLFGKWYQENSFDNHQVYRIQYNFTSYHHIEVNGAVLDSAGHTLKGYMATSIGTFRIKGDSIVVSNLKVYSNNGDLVSNQSDLKFIHSYPRYSQRVAFLDSDFVLLSYPPCGPTEDCIGSVLLKREQSQ